MISASVGNDREPGAHRVGARRTAESRAHSVGRVPRRVVRQHHDDTVGDLARYIGGPVEHARVTQARELLGLPEAGAASGRDDDHPGLHDAQSRGAADDYASSRRANSNRPADVGTTDVTWSISSGPPTISPPPFTTTIEPSSR